MTKNVNGKDGKRNTECDLAIDFQEKQRKTSSEKGSCVQRQMV